MNTVKQGIGFDHESRNRLDLVVEEKHVGIDVRAAVIQSGLSATSNRKVRRQSAERRSLPEIGLRSTKPTPIAIPGLCAVLQHHPIKGKSRVGPIRTALSA